MWTLAVIGVLTSVVGAFYYLRIVKVMYFDAPEAAVRSAAGIAVVRRRGDRAVHHVLLRLPRAVRRRGAGGGEGAVRMNRDATRCCAESSDSASAATCRMLLVVDCGNTNVVFAVRDGDDVARHLAHPHRCAAHLRRIRRLADDAARPCRPEARRHLRRGDRHRGAGRAVSPAPPLPRLVQHRAAGRPLHARLGLRYPRRQSGRGRRRPAAEHAGRRTSASAAR